MAAPKNNKYAVGNNGGRPPKYESAGSLQQEIDSYFEFVKEKDSKPTITGLALYLGFESKQSLYDYQKKDEFSYLIKRARLRVEHNYELQLMSSSATGPIFALKNMGWADKKELDLKSSDGSMSPPDNLQELYDAERSDTEPES